MMLKNNLLRRLSNEFLFFLSIVIFAVLVFNVQAGAQTKSKQKNNSQIIDQEQKEIDKAKKLHVKVRTKHVAFYTNTGTLPSKRTLTEKIIFDRNGNKKEQIRYTSLGKIEVKYVYKYDSKGNVVSLENFDGSGNVVTRRVSKYDKSGNEIQRTVYDNQHHGANEAYFTYDKNNNLIETKNYSAKNELLADITLKYQNDLPVNAVTKDGKGNVKEEINSSYDSAGRLIMEKRISQGKGYDINYKYDGNGNLIEMSNPQYHRFYDYDKNNNLIEDKMFMTNGPRQFRVRFTYLQNGLQKEEIRYDNSDKPAFYGEYKYEYYK